VCVKTFKYAYAFQRDYAASKQEIPYARIISKNIMTLSHLFLSRLPKNLIDNIYDKNRKRLSRFKSIETLIGSAEKTARILHKQYCKSNEANDMTWWFGEAEASPRDPLEEWVILQYDPGGRLRTIRQRTDTVWKLKTQYHSDEQLAILQFDPGGTNDAQLLADQKMCGYQ
jgi:hypothetical protein